MHMFSNLPLGWQIFLMLGLLAIVVFLCSTETKKERKEFEDRDDWGDQ